MPVELQPQPPPGVPAPPAGEEARNSRRKLTRIVGLGLGSLLLLLLASPLFVIRRPGGHGIISSVINAKQIGLALFDFESQYGTYPDATTAALLKTHAPSTWALGDASSNDFFQQLIVSGICQSEDMFYVRTPWTKKGDNVFTTESQALAAGECGFAYIAGLSAKDDPDTPICVSPLEPGKLTFDRKSLDGKAVILRLDNSATLVPIDKTGHVILNGMDLFDPRQPFWHGKAPNVKWPK